MNTSTRIVRNCVIGVGLAATCLGTVGCSSTKTSKWSANDPALVIYDGQAQEVNSAEQNLRDARIGAGLTDDGKGGVNFLELLTESEVSKAEKALARANARRTKTNQKLAAANAFNIERLAIVTESVDLIAEELPALTGGSELRALVVDANDPSSTELERSLMRDLRVALGQHDVIKNRYDIVESLEKAKNEARRQTGVDSDLDDFSSTGEVAGWKLEYIYVLRLNIDTNKQDGGKRLASTTSIEVIYPKEQNRNIWGRQFNGSFIFHPIRERYISETTEADLQRQYDSRMQQQSNNQSARS